MAEFAAAAGSGVVGNLLTEYSSPYVSYFFRYGTIVKNFKNQRKKLDLKKKRVDNDVDAAEKENFEIIIGEDVQDWRERAEKALEEAKTLEEEIERYKCFNWCPTWGWRYFLSKKLAEKTRCISELTDTPIDPRMGYRPDLQGIEFLIQRGFIVSESFEVAFKGIMKALKSDGVNMIGLHGMPGVGKTTLVEAVKKRAREEKLFDTVVKVTVSQTPNIDKIQNNIAEILGLTFQATTVEGKVEELLRKLTGSEQKGCKILIVVDDVWKKLELLTIGIPSGSEQKGCKILLTTRIQQVCNQMNCQEEFQLSILSENEAWTLLEDKASLKDAPSSLIKVAKEIAGECKGLPLAVVTIGEALKGQSIGGWIKANKRLKESRHLDNENVCGDIYECLELSYDYLKGENIRSCFLLCSLFPEDHDIPIEILVMFGIGHGLFCDLSSIEDLRMEICEALTELQQSGLILETDNEGTVRMHDVVRDFAHWLRSKGKNKFMVKDGLTEWPKIESFGCYEAISLWGCNINNFPGKLEFSKLKTLILEGKNSVRVPSTFFEGMKALTVLFLRDVIFSMEALQYLPNVRTLFFVRCQLENISSLRNMEYLENLEILALWDTNIHELPEELVIRGLKSLYFSCSGKQQCKFSPKLLSRFESLQELHVTSGNNVNISEVNSLSRLTALSLKVSTDQCCQDNCVFPELPRYIIAVNQDLDMLKAGLTVRTLNINDFSSFSLSAFENLFCNVKKLTLKNTATKHRDLVPNVDHGGLHELTSLELAFCEDLEYLIDTTQEPTTAFSNLVALKVEGMTCFKGLCHGQPPTRFLQMLETLTIHNCGKLQWVFQMDEMANITIIKAELEENQGPVELSNLSQLELISLSELRSIWKRPTHLVNLRNLKTMRIRGCDKLTYLFSSSLARTLEHMEELQIHDCRSLEHLITEAENEDEIVSNMQHYDQLCWPKLKTLEIRWCNRLKYVFPMTFAQGLLYLESLRIINSSQIIQVFKETKKEGQDRIVLQRLRFLELMDLRNFSRFCPENIALSLSLEKLVVFRCPFSLTHFGNHQGVALLQPQLNLKDSSTQLICNAKNLSLAGVMYPKNLFPNVDPEGLNELAFLDLKGGNELECLIDTTHQGNISTTAFLNLVELVINNVTSLKMLCKGRFSEGFLQKLEKLEIWHCREMVSLSPALQNLKEVKAINCGQLQEVFQIDEESLHEPKEKQAVLLSTLTHLELKSLPELKFIWKGPTQNIRLQSLKVAKISLCNRLNYLFSPALAQSLMLLETLKIDDCDGLEHITNELESGDEIDSDGVHLYPPFLPKLTTLEINDCPALKSVFQIPLAQYLLPQLESVSITNSPQLKQVFNVAKEKNGVDRPFALPRLQRLLLENLINLSCFCSENYLIASPALKFLRVWNCPQLNTFTILKEVNKQGQLQLQGLGLSNLGCETSNFQLRSSTYLECITVANCEKMFQDQAAGHFLSRVEHIDLHHIHQWQGPIRVASLQYLRDLKVSNCNRLKSLISSTLARNLPQLTELSVNHCEELEEIIEMDQTSASSSQGHLQPIFFPSLRSIQIEECKNLKRLFPVSVTRSVSKVESIRIVGSPKPEHVFGYEDELDIEDNHKEIITLEIKELLLQDLPSLKIFGPMGYHFKFPHLFYLVVAGCPKLTTSFSMDSEHVVHALTKAPQQVENQPPTCNDIFCPDGICEGRIPRYINVEETEDNVTQ